MQAKSTAFDPSTSPPAEHVRYYYPEPEVMLKAYAKWVEEWRLLVDISTGRVLFTEETDRLAERTKKAISQWWYSGD